MSTGSFICDEGDQLEILEKMRLLEPSEILFSSDVKKEDLVERLGLRNIERRLTDFGEWNFDAKNAEADLNRHFGTTTLEGFGVAKNKLALSAAGAIFRYLKENYRDKLLHIDKISKYDNNEFMQLDYSTVRNLELLKNSSDATEENTLFSVINKCNTASGARRLRQSLIRPFKLKTKIELRLTGVAELVKNRELAYRLYETTKTLPDLEKLSGRLGIGKLNPRQMKAISNGLMIASQIKSILKDAH